MFMRGGQRSSSSSYPYFVAPASHQSPITDAHVSAPLCGLYPAVRGYADIT